MEISPESKYARIQVLNHTFQRLTEFYQQENRAIAWTTVDGGQVDPEYLWGKYAPIAEQVRASFMFSTETRIDRHKIIALTEQVILEVQPLAFVGNNFLVVF